MARWGTRCLPSGTNSRCRPPEPLPVTVCCHHRWSVTSPAQRTPMDALVPPDVTAELTQILSNLVLGDNEIRSKYTTTSSQTEYLTTHFFQRRSRRRRAPGSQTRCLSSRSDSVCNKSRHRRSGRSAMPLTFLSFSMSSIVTLITNAYCIYRCVHFLSSSFDASSSVLHPLLAAQNLRLLPG